MESSWWNTKPLAFSCWRLCGDVELIPEVIVVLLWSPVHVDLHQDNVVGKLKTFAHSTCSGVCLAGKSTGSGANLAVEQGVATRTELKVFSSP